MTASSPLGNAAEAGEAPGAVLYESATTRVRHSAAAGVVCKDYLGPRAAERMGIEHALLARLAGVEGVAQLAGNPQGATIALRAGGGVPLSQLVQAGPCDVATVLAIASQLARTLAEVHRRGVIHRDINPANILVADIEAPAGEALRTELIDFDLGVAADEAQPPSDGTMVGTLGYLAPEQTGRTGRTLDQRADLYALGATLYELACGRLPFEAQDTLQLIHDHLVRAPMAPHIARPGVPRALSAIVLRLLAKEPEQRYQSADGLAHDIETLRERLDAGKDDEFTLGERDFPARLAPPQALVGRDAERALLRSAFAQAVQAQPVQQAPRRAVLVEGAAGVGKSALIQDLRQHVQAAGGWFVQGKVDQLQREGAEGGAVVQALRALGQLLLTESSDTLDALRRRILHALGPNAALATQALPEFALLLGEQRHLPEADPRWAQARFIETTLDLLGAVASPAQPLVLVLDDLQWAGNLTLRFFEQAMLAAQLHGVMIVGAFRGGELEAGPALGTFLAHWQRLEHGPLHIALENLTAGGAADLAGQMLRLPPERATALAQVLGELAGGNPFDTIELVNALRQGGTLRLARQGWEWDDGAIRRFVGRSNVVDLLAVRIARLAPASRALLEVMCCLGGAVAPALLQAAAGVDDAQLQGRLAPPLDDGLLVTDAQQGGALSFRHDRVQQAIAARMGEGAREQVQLAVARRLAAHAGHADKAAQHYAECIGLLDDAIEMRVAARLLQGVARRLAGIANHAVAERYLGAAGTLLDRAGDVGDMHLRAAVDAQLHTALYCLGRLDEMDAVYARIEARAEARARGPQDLTDLIEATSLRMRSLDMRSRMRESLALGERMLAQLGVTVRGAAGDSDTAARLDALGDWVRQDSRLDPATRPRIRDTRLLHVATILSRMVRSAYLQEDMRALTWLLLECQSVWVLHGPCPDLVVSLARMGPLLFKTRQDFRLGYEIVRQVVAVGEALGFEPQVSEARAIFAAYCCGWFEPIEAAFRHAELAYEGVRMGGDVSYACYVWRASRLFLLQIAPTIDVCAAEIEAGIALCERVGNEHAAALYVCERQVLRALRGATRDADSLSDERFDEDAFVANVTAAMPVVAGNYHARRALLAMILGDAAALAKHVAGMTELLGSEPWDVEVQLPLALALAWKAQEQARETGSAASPSLLAALASPCAWLAERAADQPVNFLHLALLVQAEQAHALGDNWKAAQAFDAALGEARSRARPWHRALITERAGLFYLQAGLQDAGRRLMTEACELYAAWGADAKVARMERDHAFLRANPVDGPGTLARAALVPGQSVRSVRSVRSGSGSVSSDAVDLVGVLRASQALSSETSLPRLVARVTEVLAALGGATSVRLVSCQGEGHGEGHGEGWVPLGPSQSAGEVLPLSAIDYAQRTGQALVVEDAVRDDRFARDPAFAGAPLCSLLVAPIAGVASHDHVRAMLVLENRLHRGAFSADRLDAVMLIAGQLAVSLANVQLYESLEERVKSRTRELEQMQAQLVATARRAGKAEIATNVLHNVGNVLNSVNVSASVVRGIVAASRVDGLVRAVALMQGQADLAAFFATDPRAKVLLPYMSEAASSLQTDQQAALAELDRLAGSVEHINHVVASQQSNAGPSSVQEITSAQELLDEALRLSGDAIGSWGVTVTRRYGELPQVALDKQRLLQILVNLVSNAVQAMEATPQPARELVLGAGMVRQEGGEGGGRLHITVRDTGEGIAPENLTRIFAHGFTTRASGHGFGLHSSALAAMEMGGRLTAESDGPGRGATFTVDLPLDPR